MKVQPIGANQTEVSLADGTEILFSYGTPVAALVPGKGWIRSAQKWCHSGNWTSWWHSEGATPYNTLSSQANPMLRSADALTAAIAAHCGCGGHPSCPRCGWM